MKLYLNRTPSILKWYYSEFHWPEHTGVKKLYLTFDDGPNPQITDFILSELSKWNANATFFCLGKNIDKSPSLFTKIINAHHTIGNHTFNHLNGWNSNTDTYLRDVKKCTDLINSNSNNPKKLFRPPYGRITSKQIQTIKKTHKIVLWDYLFGDFDQNISKENCLKKALGKIQNNDILVLHDNQKSYNTLKFILPRILSHYSKQGFTFESF